MEQTVKVISPGSGEGGEIKIRRDDVDDVDDVDDQKYNSRRIRDSQF